MMAAIRGVFNQRAETWDDTNAAERIAVSERLVCGLGGKAGKQGAGRRLRHRCYHPLASGAVGEEGSMTAVDIAERMLGIAREGFKSSHNKLNSTSVRKS